MNTSKMCGMVAMELDKIEERGLNASNIETVYKLVDIYKDLATIKAMEGDDADSKTAKMFPDASPEERKILERYAERLAVL